MALSIISVEGSPFDIGYEHGRNAKEAIRENFEFYLSFWKYYGGAELEQVLEKASQFIPYIDKLDSELVEELKGVAEGSGMRFEEIVALNSRWELNYAYMPIKPSIGIPGGCTAYALTPEVTQNSHTFIGQNWDYKPGLKNTCIILRIKQEKKPDIIMHTEAGIIGHKGFNSAGLGLCLNFIRSEKDKFRPGLPVWIKARSILNSETLPECMKMLMVFEGPNSVNLLIAHRNGEIIDVECTPYDSYFLYPQEGVITHANHFKSPNFRVKDTGKWVLHDTVIRDQRAFRLFQERKGILEFETIKEVLTDHFGLPDSICRHGDQKLDPNEQWETITSMVIDLTESTLFYTDGPPCLKSYKTVTFGE